MNLLAYQTAESRYSAPAIYQALNVKEFKSLLLITHGPPAAHLAQVCIPNAIIALLPA